VNFGPDDVPLPAGLHAVVRSGPGPDGVLPVDTAAWLVPDEEDR
jgi:alpha-glucosidase